MPGNGRRISDRHPLPLGGRAPEPAPGLNRERRPKGDKRAGGIIAHLRNQRNLRFRQRPSKNTTALRLTLRNACITITTKRHRRRASAPAPRSIAASRVSAPFTRDIDNRIMRPRSAGGTTQDRGRGRFQTRPCPHDPRRCPPEVEDRLGRNADRQPGPGHCGIVAQVLGCGRMTPAPTSKPDGHPQDAGATLVVAVAPRGLTVQGPSESRKHPADV